MNTDLIGLLKNTFAGYLGTVEGLEPGQLNLIRRKLWFDKTQLWRDVCVAAASHSDTPHLIADEALKQFETITTKIKQDATFKTI